MADITLNFTSQWPSVQVAKVITDLETDGVYEHGLDYPPFATLDAGLNGLEVDNKYVYMPRYRNIAGSVITVYAINISEPFEYDNTESTIGDIDEYSNASNIDLRDFLLHSRAVSPMLLSVRVKEFSSGSDYIEYHSPLDYPSFSFGFVHVIKTVGIYVADRWMSAPIGNYQSWPWMVADGYNSKIMNSGSGQDMMADKGTIVTLRNPAIITSNTVSVHI